MNSTWFLRQTKKLGYAFLLFCLLISNSASTPKVQAAGTCSEIFNNGVWVVVMCPTDPNNTDLMEVVLNGVSKGQAVQVRISHKSQAYAGIPQVAVVDSHGYVRLKQNADPQPPIPFGTSFILGPAYWSSAQYYHNPILTRFEFDTSGLSNPNGLLRMQAQGTNHSFSVSYKMTMPPPRDRQTRIHVDQTYTATSAITIDATHRQTYEGFKLVQASSMFINATDCMSPYTNCHDSNAARYIGSDLIRHQYTFSGPVTAYFGGSPTPLGSTWVDLLHTDDTSWQGNTPNERIALDSLPSGHTITPQGNIEGGHADPTDTDNVSLWLHDDGQDSVSWTSGRSSNIGYWLLAQDNPPDPWTDLGLRAGLTFLNFEGSYNCFPVKDANQSTTAAVAAVDGYSNKAIQLNYSLGSTNNNWAQVRCNFSPPLNLSAYDHLRFEWRGNPSAGNSMQVGLINPTAGGENIFARGYHHATQHAWWGQTIVPFSFLEAWTNGTHFDPSQVSAIFISVIKDGADDAGGSGKIALDNLGAYNVASRSVPGAFEALSPNPSTAQAAADWIASQQQPNGLIKSWEDEQTCIAHTYDQALALIVFSKQGMWSQADKLVDELAAVQNADGSWTKSHNCSDESIADGTRWEGDIAWAIYGLNRYRSLGGTHIQAATAAQKGAAWLATRLNQADGCLVIDHTEGTIDAWWALQSAGPTYADEAEKIKTCLLTYYWDNNMGRFKGGRNWWQPYLDNQTWGAAFLKAIGESEKARRALSYAWNVLRLPAQGDQLFGFDGQAGPWSVWNEGMGQYIAAGGSGGQNLLQELLVQQRDDGAMPGSPDEFNGGGVWTTVWHGVAPTAWLYNALANEPFHASSTNTEVYIGGKKQASYFVPLHGNIRQSYNDVNNGPLKIQSTTGTPMVASERVAYSPDNGATWTSYSELMGMPVNQLTSSYTFPWYNNASLNTQLRFGNVGTAATTVTITIGGQIKGTYDLLPNQSTRASYLGLDAGPVKVTSSRNVPIIASERVAYFDGTHWTSFSEMMGLPSTRLTTSYIFPWYNNADLNSQLRFGNVGTKNTTVTVTIGGVPRGSYDLTPNASQRVSYLGLNAGPVKITSTGGVPIIASMRVAYTPDNGATWPEFSEMMGMPTNSLSTSYSFPVYNNVGLNTQLRFGNVSMTTTTVTVTIGGVLKDSYILAPNASQRVSYPFNDGPLVIQSSGGVPIIASMRVAYFDTSLSKWTSFAELMGLPRQQLTTSYLFPWYNNIDLDTQLRFGVP